MRNKKLLHSAVIAGFLFGFTQMVTAAPITWVDTGTFSSENDINLSGTVLRAGHISRTTGGSAFSTNSFAVSTASGIINFVPMGSDSYADDITNPDASIVTSKGIYGADSIYQNGGSSTFDDAMDTVAYNNGDPGFQGIELVLSNLTVGETYLVQLFRSAQINAVAGHNYVYFSDSATAFGGNYTPTNTLLGTAAYGTGQFTAEGTTQSVWAHNSGLTDDGSAPSLGAGYNGYVLSSIPEPSSVVLVAGAAAGLLYVRRQLSI